MSPPSSALRSSCNAAVNTGAALRRLPCLATATISSIATSSPASAKTPISGANAPALQSLNTLRVVPQSQPDLTPIWFNSSTARFDLAGKKPMQPDEERKLNLGKSKDSPLPFWLKYFTYNQPQPLANLRPTKLCAYYKSDYPPFCNPPYRKRSYRRTSRSTSSPRRTRTSPWYRAESPTSRRCGPRR